MKTKYIALTALIAAPLLWASSASAQDYCREYQRTITVGGMMQNGYGTACYMPDGSWKITDLQGPQAAQYAVREDIYNDFGRSAPPVVVVNNPRPVVYYQPRPVYRPTPSYSSVYFSFGNDKRWDRHDRWDRNDRWDRHDRHDNHRGRGRGHDRH